MSSLFRVRGVGALLVVLAGLAGPAGADVLSDSFVTVREGDLAQALVGFSVGTAGDVNGDGYSDLLLNGSQDNGTVWCYLGGPAPDFATPVWTVNGGAQNWLGSKVSTAGDLNGDGYDDVMVGTPVYANGEFAEGAVYVYLGSPTGPNQTPQAILEPNISNIGFGTSIDTAGDVNGDGYDDILVGAPRYADGQASEGRAYLFLGTPDGISTTHAWTFESNAASANFGMRVCGTGDVDADGFDDVLVAAPDLSDGETGEGRVYLFRGSPGGLSLVPDWTYESEVIGGRCGWGLGMAGDVNGDGYSDVAFDKGSNNPAHGAVLVFHGGPAGPGAAPDRVYPNNHGGFADGLYTAGDVNGDGCADLLASEMSAEGNTGAITVLGGSMTGNTLLVLAYRPGLQAAEQFGADVRPAGDVNGDGFGDVIAGAPRHDNGQTDEGIVRLWLGRPSLPAQQVSRALPGVQVSSLFGYTLAQGDWNGDGHSDLAVGIPYWDTFNEDEGVVYVYYGSPDGYGATADLALAGSEAQSQFGYGLASAGDVDNDGYEDLLIGEPFGNPVFDNAGQAFLYRGSANGLESSPSWTGAGEALGAWYGMSVAGAGDVNGDGYGDVLVGAPRHRTEDERGGKVLLYPGGPNGLGAEPIWTGLGTTDSDEFGRSVAGAGDVDGDGYADVLVGAPGEGVAGEGFVHLFFGSPSGTDGTWSTRGNQTSAHFGARVAAGGDINGDGYSDFLHAAPDYDADGIADRGLVVAYLGQADRAPLLNFQRLGNALADRFGFGLAGGGDVNNDGYSDVVGAAPWSNSGADDAGSVMLFLGGAAGVAPAPAWTRHGADPFTNLGFSVNTSGDITGDGVADIIAGQPYYASSLGRVVCYYGGRDLLPGEEPGVLRRPRQLRADETTPVALGGTSDAADGFMVSSLGRTARGRDQVRLEVQVSPLATSWTEPPQPADWLDTGLPVPGLGSAVLATATVTGLPADTEVHWRVRFRGESPFFPTTPWCSVPSNGGTETDLRTGGGGSSSVDGADPTQGGGPGSGKGLGSGSIRFARVTPNPSHDAALLSFHSPVRGETSLTIHDASGRRVATLWADMMERGDHQLAWDLRDEHGREVAAGMYMARLAQDANLATIKLIVRR